MIRNDLEIMSISSTENQQKSEKVMLLTGQLQPSPSGGRELLCKLNHDVLCELFGEHLVVHQLPKQKLKGIRAMINAFRGHIDGLTDASMNSALQSIQTENVTKIFVDGSNLGGFVGEAKRQLSRLEICTFFHNVESRFFLGSLKETKNLRSLAILVVNYLAERKAVRHSDKIICLSERDSNLLRKTYGRGATHISPMAMQDKAPADLAKLPGVSSEKFALFVGGDFYANRAGASWFAKKVAPRVRMKTCVVGRGLENLKPELDGVGNVEVIGAVESLSEWYQNATVVIAPIFDGSGMKTKVAEALMYGKKIIGTPEAFSGYDDVADRAGWVCATADEFVTAFGQAEDMVKKPYDPELRSLFEERYSFPAARSRFAEILGSSS